ncbi:potassium-transporting ATPase subunit C [Crossiella equi]|uniref:potassium-transporting ATPase subunit C n=1 Tax=Crossiella equi TaxID=130796 RepID=UPI000A3AF37A|nr:potassium-transporting ATPase subunit C [Crossiella equi]
MSTLWKQTWAGLRVLLVLTVLLGVVYPLAIWGIGRIPGLSARAEGSVVYQNGQPVGSELIGVDLVDERAKDNPTLDRWFHNRPSAAADSATSGGSNKAGDSQDLLKTVTERRDAVAAREQVPPARVPADAVTASASGLDPHISPDYARLQAARVARENGVPLATVERLIEENTSSGGIGEPGVNVLKLNLAVQAARR